MERVYGGCLCYGPPIENGFYYDMFMENNEWVAQALGSDLSVELVVLVSSLCYFGVYFKAWQLSVWFTVWDGWQTQNRWIVITLMLSSWIFLGCGFEMTSFYICPKQISSKHRARDYFSEAFAYVLRHPQKTLLPRKQLFTWPFPETDAFLPASSSRRARGVLSN